MFADSLARETTNHHLLGTGVRGNSGDSIHVEMGITLIKMHDRVLAAHYGFTDEELDFVPSTQLRAGNYDIKYRMGRDAENEEE